MDYLANSGIEAVTMTQNTTTLIAYIKELSLCKRTMYLVINLAVIHLFVGVSMISESCFMGNECEFWMVRFRNHFHLLILAFYLAFPMASAINLTLLGSCILSCIKNLINFSPC